MVEVTKHINAITPEVAGIGLKNEKSLHSSIKEWYSITGDRFEVKVGQFIIDIVRNNLLIEIQTKNFYSIRRKLKILLSQNHCVRLVYPISKEKTITRIDTSNNIISSRKSPKEGKVADIFNELIRVPDLINEKNLSMEVLMIKEEETRIANNKGSWRRKGVSIQDRKLIHVYNRIQFNEKNDFLIFLPDNMCQSFSNKNLAEITGMSIFLIRKMTYCLRKMKVIREVGKIGNELLFKIDSCLENAVESKKK